MDRETFKMIMRDFFIPYVQKEGEALKSNGRAALFVDGHLSRYDVKTFDMLDKAGIDLIILPTHSSQIIQPLDITLNGLIRRVFPVAFRKGVPKHVLEGIERLRRLKTRPPILRAYSEQTKNAT